MNLELLLLRLFLNNTDLFIKYNRYTKTKYNNVYTKIYHALSSLKEDGKPSHLPVDLAFAFHSCYPVLPAAEAEAAEGIFVALNAVEVGADQARTLLGKLKERHLAGEIALAAVEVASGDGEYLSLSEKIQEL